MSRLTAILAPVAVLILAAVAFSQSGQPIRVSPPWVGGGVIVPAQADNVLRIPYELWGRSWYIPDGARVTLVGAPEYYASNGRQGTACAVYVERQEYPVLRLYLGPGGDDRPSAAEVEARTAQWINGLLWARAAPKAGAVVDWVPRLEDGTPVNIAAWGWSE